MGNHKKHRMKYTSILAFEDVIPTLQEREMLILRFMKGINRPCNNRMINEYSKLVGQKLDINQITPRTKSLRELNVLTYVKKDKCPYSKKLTDYYQINDSLNQILVILTHNPNIVQENIEVIK